MSLRSKRRNRRNGIEYRRRGTGKPKPPLIDLYIPNAAKLRKPKPEPFDDPRTVAQAWGNEAPGGDMAAMRADWLRWEERKNKQRAKAKKAA